MSVNGNHQFPSDADTRTKAYAAAAVGNIPTLLMLLVQATGDTKWLGARYRLKRTVGLGDNDSGGLSEELQSEIRLAAAEAIMRLLDGDPPAIPSPSESLMVRMMGAFMAEEVAAEYAPMLRAEFARRSGLFETKDDLRRPQPAPGFTVLIVGLGVAGIVAAKYLKDMGVAYLIVDKNPSAGGNWYQNTYPGAGVDTPSHLYSFSFAKNEWTKHFELRDELREYFDRVVTDIDVRERTRFQTEVTSASYDETTQTWRVTLRNCEGKVETASANVVLSAVGILNRPRLPDVKGLDKFDGRAFHTAQWPEDVDLAGKRVAIVGTGASAMQVVPAIVDEVKSLVIFQQSPPWIAPFDKFGEEIPEATRFLLREVPVYHAWYWLRLFWQFGDRVIDSLRKDPDWPYPERSVNARNDAHRRFFTGYLEGQLGAKPELLPKVLPSYPPYGKRILLDNGWYRALLRDNVELVTEAVTEMRKHTVVAKSGDEHEVDVVIWCTGFEATRFVASMDVFGKSGIALRDVWHEDDPRAYLGIAVPEFPNFFMLGGPNTFPGSGSFMFFMEMQMQYICNVLAFMFSNALGSANVRKQVCAEYNLEMEKAHAGMVFMHPGVQNYYRNSEGRVVFVYPFRNVDFWNATREVDPADYEFCEIGDSVHTQEKSA